MLSTMIRYKKNLIKSHGNQCTNLPPDANTAMDDFLNSLHTNKKLYVHST